MLDFTFVVVSETVALVMAIHTGAHLALFSGVVFSRQWHFHFSSPLLMCKSKFVYFVASARMRMVRSIKGHNGSLAPPSLGAQRQYLMAVCCQQAGRCRVNIANQTSARLQTQKTVVVSDEKN